MARRLHTIGRSYQQIHGAKPILFEPECLPDTALDAVALNGPRGVLAGDQHPKPRSARITPAAIENVTL